MSAVPPAALTAATERILSEMGKYPVLARSYTGERLREIAGKFAARGLEAAEAACPRDPPACGQATGSQP
jgi:hypothetical protein